jgi:tRNA dimethylallyltransferase
VTAPRGVLAIVGPTGSGKTALAVAVAERLSGEVISADAFCVYRGLDAGTAKPSLLERRGIRHEMIDIVDPSEPFNAGEFARRARAHAQEMLSRGKLPILCGGTGFYVRAFFRGLFQGPTRNEALRTALGEASARRGVPFLWRMLDLLDPESGRNVAPNDEARLTRYLEIALLSGYPASRLFQERPGEGWDGPAVKIVLALPRPLLYGRITERFRRSIEGELPGEVRRLLSEGVTVSAPGMAAIGYRETAEFVAGRISRAEWEERVLRQTRRYAKRQETWFRAEDDYVPLRADAPGLVEDAVAEARLLFS